MHAPQIIVMVLFALSLGIKLEKATTDHPPPGSLADLGVNFVGALLMGSLLWWGGFWS